MKSLTLTLFVALALAACGAKPDLKPCAIDPVPVYEIEYDTGKPADSRLMVGGEHTGRPVLEMYKAPAVTNLPDQFEDSLAFELEKEPRRLAFVKVSKFSGGQFLSLIVLIEGGGRPTGWTAVMPCDPAQGSKVSCRLMPVKTMAPESSED